MAKHKLWLFSFAVSFFLCLAYSLPAQIDFSGNNYLEYSYDTSLDTVYFENWADISMGYKHLRLGARYEFHLPPQPYSQDSVGQGLSQRFLEYRKNGLTLTIGNFYSLFGRGLVLRSFENRMLRWDTNLDGVKVEYYHDYIDFQILGGRPRDRRGRRQEALQGGTFTIKPWRYVQFGSSFVTSHLPLKGRVNWGSVHTALNLNWGNFYVERAMKDFPDADPSAKAFYVMGNLFRSPFTFLVEYKNYDQFDLTERTTTKNPPSELTYNNPPVVARDHLFTLLNRHQLVQNANDEKGYLLELTYSYHDQLVLTLSHSQTENHQGLSIYREYYGQMEWDPLDVLNLVGGAGEQKDPEARYLNVVGSGKWGFSDFYSAKLIVEHQHVTIRYNDRQFYNQLYTFTVDRSSRFTLSFLTETSTDQQSARNLWLAGQLDVHFLENFDLTVFGGRRREGKICIGGICVFRPEFEGLEVRLMNRW